MLAGCGDDDPDTPPPPPEDVDVAERTYALLVGCSEYPELKRLYGEGAYEASVRLFGPENDVRLMRRVLHDYLGVPDENVRWLAGWPDDAPKRPTRSNILREFDRLIEEVPAGSRVFFLFSGHGSHQPDADGDEPDGEDEIFMPADVGKWNEAERRVQNAIDDDEIRARMRALREKGATVFAVFDCCHAGTLLRAPGPSAAGTAEEPTFQARDRQVDARDLGVPPGRPPDPPGVRGLGTAGANTAVPRDSLLQTEDAAPGRIAAIYAAHSTERASELKLPRNKNAPGRAYHGICTFYLALALQRHGGSLTLAELSSHVRQGYDRLGWTKSTPLAEGDLSIRMLPGRPVRDDPLVLDRMMGDLVVEAGRIRGLTVGSELEVFAEGAFGDRAGSLGRVRIEAVRALRALCGPVEGGPALDAIPAGAAARLVKLAPGPVPLRFGAVDAQGAPLPTDTLARIRREAALGEGSGLDLEFVGGERAPWRMYALPHEAGRPERFALQSMDAGFETQVVALAGLREALGRIQRAEHLRALSQDPALGGLPTGLEVAITVRHEPDGPEEPFTTDMKLRPGGAFVLRLVNGSGRELDVVVRQIDALQREIHLWPEDGPSRRFARGETTAEEPVEITLWDHGLGLESLVVVAATREHGEAPLAVGGVRVAEAEDPEDDTTRGDDGDGGGDGLMSTGPVERPVGVKTYRYQTTWGRIGVPTPDLEGMTTLSEPVTTPAAAGPEAAEQTWTAARVIPGDDYTADILLVRGPGADGGGLVLAWFLDADGDVNLGGLPLIDAVRAAATRTLPFDAGFLMVGEKHLAAYPAHEGDTRLGRLVQGTPPGDGADREYVRLSEGGWGERAVSGALLSTEHLSDEAQEDGRAERLLFAWRRFTKLR